MSINKLRYSVIRVVLAMLITGLGAANASVTHAQPSHLRPTSDQRLIARVTLKSDADLKRFIALGLDCLEMRDGDDLFILTWPAEVERLRREGWQIKIDERQTTTLHAQRASFQRAASPGLFRDGYHTVSEMWAFLSRAEAQHPDLAEVFVYGSSWNLLNRDKARDDGSLLCGIKLTNKRQPDPNKPVFFLMAGHHPREIVTSELALRFIDYLLNNYGVDGDITWLLNEHCIVIMPVANPDGHALVEQGYYQRKNTNITWCGNSPWPPDNDALGPGVDLNRNHAYMWLKWLMIPTMVKDGACNQQYPGPEPASEPETVALQNLIRSLFWDQRGPGEHDPAPSTTSGILITLHAYSNLVLWPWGYTAEAPPNSADLSAIGHKLAAYNGYTAGQAIPMPNLLRYFSSGSINDWAYGELGIPAITFEVGPMYGECSNFFPPLHCLDGGDDGSFWSRNLPAFLYAARIARAPYQLVRGPEPVALSGKWPDDKQLELQAQLDERAHGGQAIVIAEYYIDTPPWRGGLALPMTPLDGSYDSPVEIATAVIGPLNGQHLIYVRGKDLSGNRGPVRAFSTQPAASPLADLSITSQVTTEPVVTGANFTYQLTVKNNSPVTATQATVTDQLPGTVTFVSCAATGGGVCDGADSKRTITFASLAAGQSATITLVAKLNCSVVDGTIINNTATINSLTSETELSNNLAHSSVHVSNPPPMILCPGNITALTRKPGDPGGPVNYPLPTATDNCDDVAIVCSPPQGANFLLGVSAVTCVATDAGGAKAACSFVVSVFDVSLQDDRSGDTLLFNSFSGDYKYTRCGAVGGFTLTGRGVVNRTGCLITLTDPKVTATIDRCIIAPLNRGSAIIRRTPFGATFSIKDSNASDNTSDCH